MHPLYDSSLARRMRCAGAIVGTFSLVCGCASTPDLPTIPEYHPASARASQAPMVNTFDVLAVVPAPQPELPVPPAVELPPPESPMKDMQHGQDMEMKQDSAATSSPEGSAEKTAAETLHGEHSRPGMRHAMPGQQGQAPHEDHARPSDTLYKERVDDDVKRMEAPMQPVKIPSEQRGMGVDQEHYHTHEHHDSNHIVHPNRSLENAPVAGKQAWMCPSHPEVAVETPGGRCPECQTVLVPVRVEP